MIAAGTKGAERTQLPEGSDNEELSGNRPFSPMTWASSSRGSCHSHHAMTAPVDESVPLRTVFNLLDRDHRGKINVREFATVVQALTKNGDVPLAHLVSLFPSCALRARSAEDERRLLAMLVAPCCEDDESVDVELNFQQFVHKYDALENLFDDISGIAATKHSRRQSQRPREDEDSMRVGSVYRRTLSDISSISEGRDEDQEDAQRQSNSESQAHDTLTPLLSENILPTPEDCTNNRKRAEPSSTPISNVLRRESVQVPTMFNDDTLNTMDPPSQSAVHPRMMPSPSEETDSSKTKPFGKGVVPYKRRAISIEAISINSDQDEEERTTVTFAKTDGEGSTDEAKPSSMRRRHKRRTQSVHADWEINAEELKMGRSLGGGKFGLVREAFWRSTPVAVKRLKASVGREDDAAAVERFHQEAFLLANMRHPNILMFMGAVIDKENSSIELVTELLDISLHDRLYNGGTGIAPITRAEWFSITLQMCCGLNYLHLCDPPIIHRDIKPKNVLIRNPLHIKIADFGISIVNDSPGQERIVGLCGTLPYMSPQLLCNEPYDSKVDVYSFAMVAYETLCRNRPLAAEPPMRIILSVGIHKHRPKIPDDTPADIAAIIRQAWAHDPDDRPSMEELLNMLTDADKNPNYEDQKNLPLLSGVSPVNASEAWDDKRQDFSDDNFQQQESTPSPVPMSTTTL